VETLVTIGSTRNSVWLVSPSGSIPGENWRPHRYSIAGKLLSEAGYNVTWWTASFSHHTKRQRCDTFNSILDGPGFTINLIPVGGYRRHIGLARLFFLVRFAVRFYWMAREATSPPFAIIVASPPPGTDFSAFLLARRFQAKLIVDVIDLWPELFMAFVSRSLAWVARALFFPLYAARRWVLSRAAAVTSVCDTYLSKVGLNGDSRRATRSIYWGSDPRLNRLATPMPADRVSVVGRRKRAEELWIVYAGTLGNNYDLATVLDAAALLKAEQRPVLILLAGQGPQSSMIKHRLEADHLNEGVLFLGMLTHEQLSSLYADCDAGLCPYIRGSTVAMPIKFYDYIASGLPVINSLPGELRELIETCEVGLQYEAGDAESLRRALVRLAENGERRATMARKAREMAARFHPDHEYQKFLQLLNALGGQPERREPVCRD